MTFIQDEHPQTIALILAHLVPNKASEILVGLPDEKRVEVVNRISRMEQTSPEVIKEVEKGLEHRLSGLMADGLQRVGGIEAVAEILNLVDRTTEKGILESLGEEDPELVEQIRRLMFVFEDILLVNDKGIQTVLKEVETSDLVLALPHGDRGAQGEDLRQHVRPRRAAHQGGNGVHGPGAVERRGDGPAEDRGRGPAAGGFG